MRRLAFVLLLVAAPLWARLEAQQDSLAVTACIGTDCASAWMRLTAPRDTVNSAALYDDYSPISSPHWRHIRTMATDFISNWTPTERAWAAAHYDLEMSGNGAAWLALNPTVKTYPYTLLWTTLIPTSVDRPNLTGTYSEDMRTWYAAHPQYQMERAFLHDTTTGTPADSAHRYVLPIWDSRRWFMNPADSGLIAYDVDRYQRIIAAAGASGGVFVDESGTGDMSRATPSREYPVAAGWPPVSPYFADYARLVARIRAAIAPKGVILNTSGYVFPGDSVDALASGGVHLEKENNPLSSNTPGTFAWIDKLLAAGVFVDFVNAYDMADATKLPAKGYGSDSLDAYQRVKMAELASYYMVVPTTPDHLALQLVNMWDRPFSSVWLKAQEADIGHPTAARTVQTLTMKDAAGQPVVLYERAFTRALVIFRAQTGWGAQSYADSTAVPVALPAGETWLPLHGDGTLGHSVTSIALRNSEAAILIKGSALGGP